MTEVKGRHVMMVLHYFRGDVEKASTWWLTPNPHLGDLAPLDFYRVGRGHKVERFIERQLGEEDEND